MLSGSSLELRLEAGVIGAGHIRRGLTAVLRAIGIGSKPGAQLDEFMPSLPSWVASPASIMPQLSSTARLTMLQRPGAGCGVVTRSASQ